MTTQGSKLDGWGWTHARSVAELLFHGLLLIFVILETLRAGEAAMVIGASVSVLAAILAALICNFTKRRTLLVTIGMVVFSGAMMVREFDRERALVLFATAGFTAGASLSLWIGRFRTGFMELVSCSERPTAIQHLLLYSAGSFIALSAIFKHSLPHRLTLLTLLALALLPLLVERGLRRR
jgi:hypothetical protein